MVAAFPPSEGLPLDHAPAETIADTSAAALRRRVITDLARLITHPAEGVSALDRVEAVRLLGQLGGPLARLTLAGVLREGPHLRPPAVGRWLRDTALATLLRDPDRAATDRLLISYYRLDRRLRRGRLERNLVYDDIPLLLSQHRAGVLVRGYLLPLLGTLVILAALPQLLFWLHGLNSPLNAVDGFLGFLFVLLLGLCLFNIHQLLLVLLVAWAGPRLPLLHIQRPAIRIAWAMIFALAAFLITFLGSGATLMFAGGFTEETEDFVRACVFIVPLLILPCYMLAHDLETDAQIRTSSRFGVYNLAVVLRGVAGLLYIGFVVMAIGLSFLHILRVNRGNVRGDEAVLPGTYPSLIYLALSPVLVLLVLALLGWIQIRVRGKSGKVGVAE